MTIRPTYIAGVDIAQDSFTVTGFDSSQQSFSSTFTFSNQEEGFRSFEEWFKEQGYTPSELLICLEDTGVYSEAFCYWFAARGYRLAVEPPHHIHKKIHDPHQKTDELDSQRIADYAYRFFDKLHIWQIPHELQEQLSVLLSTREQFIRQCAAHQQTCLQLKRKVIRTPMAETSLAKIIGDLKEQIKKIDDEIKKLISQHPTWKQMIALLTSIPGVGILLATNLMVLTSGFTITDNPRQLAAHLGISPCKYKSGKSVHKPSRSRGYGDSRLRKLLYLATMSQRTHHRHSQIYFLRKVQEGKSKRLVLNNMANKLLKIICAVVRNRQSFIENYVSVNPMLLSA